MSDIRQARETLVARILEGDGMASPAQRRAAFDNALIDESLSTLIEKVMRHAREIDDSDIAVVRASGLSEDQVFEIVVCAALGQATRQYESARAARDRHEVPVRDHSRGVAATDTRGRQAGHVPPRFLRSAHESRHP